MFDDEDYDGIIDDDPAMDLALLDEIEKEERQGGKGSGNGGCLGVLLLLAVPAALLFALGKVLWA